MSEATEACTSFATKKQAGTLFTRTDEMQASIDMLKAKIDAFQAMIQQMKEDVLVLQVSNGHARAGVNGIEHRLKAIESSLFQLTSEQLAIQRGSSHYG